MNSDMLRRLAQMRHVPVSPRLWLRRLAFWLGAVLVGLMALGFAELADEAQQVFLTILAHGRFWVFLVAPLGLGLSVYLTRTVFPGAQGSGIPQVIAALHMTDRSLIASVLSLRVGLGKIVLTLLGLLSGASIGREGPTVQVGASIMQALGQALRLSRAEAQRGLVLAGGAAGVAAAFNTPLAGIVFAIEELSHSYETRTSGIVLTAVILAGITTLAFMGNYSYFGVASVQLDWGRGWVAVLLCAVLGGLCGGLFSQALVTAARGLPGRAGLWVARYPVRFAMLCGLVLAVLGILSGGNTYGTGYTQARHLVEGHTALPDYYFLLKLLATIVSYLSGIPGGIFAPSLAVGASLGHWLSHFVPGAPASAVVLLGMVAYFSGVVQAPITAFVIVMEMTNNQMMVIPLMAASMVAFGVSRLVCRRALYGALAARFLAAVDPSAHNFHEEEEFEPEF